MRLARVQLISRLYDISTASFVDQILWCAIIVHHVSRLAATDKNSKEIGKRADCLRKEGHHVGRLPTVRPS